MNYNNGHARKYYTGLNTFYTQMVTQHFFKNHDFLPKLAIDSLGERLLFGL